jgi:hypothetical protein
MQEAAVIAAAVFPVKNSASLSAAPPIKSGRRVVGACFSE